MEVKYWLIFIKPNVESFSSISKNWEVQRELHSKFTRKHLCQGLSFNVNGTLAQVFSCEFCKISKNSFFTEHLRATASARKIQENLNGSRESFLVANIIIQSFWSRVYQRRQVKLIKINVASKFWVWLTVVLSQRNNTCSKSTMKTLE